MDIRAARHMRDPLVRARGQYLGEGQRERMSGVDAALACSMPVGAMDEEETLSEFTFASLLVKGTSDETWTIRKHPSGIY